MLEGVQYPNEVNLTLHLGKTDSASQRVNLALHLGKTDSVSQRSESYSPFR